MRAVVAAACAVFLAGCGADAGDADDFRVAVDAELAPVVDTDGIVAAIAARKGQPLLVNFWARWCSPCVDELPDLVAARADIREAGGEVLGFAMDLWAPGYELEESRRELPGFAREHGVDFPVMLYRSTDPIPVLERLGIPGDLPSTLAIDRDGNVVLIHEGRASPDELDELVRLAVGG